MIELRATLGWLHLSFSAENVAGSVLVENRVKNFFSLWCTEFSWIFEVVFLNEAVGWIQWSLRSPQYGEYTLRSSRDVLFFNLPREFFDWFLKFDTCLLASILKVVCLQNYPLDCGHLVLSQKLATWVSAEKLACCPVWYPSYFSYEICWLICISNISYLRL